MGTTAERKQHSNIVREDRNVSEGGIVLGRGERDTDHCYLDFLLNNGLLGNIEDSGVRYYTGYRLRELHFQYRSSGKSMTGEPGGTDKHAYVSDGETSADIAEQAFHDVMLVLPTRYRQMIRMACTGEPQRFEITPDTRVMIYEACEEIRDGLDALYGAFHRADGKNGGPRK